MDSEKKECFTFFLAGVGFGAIVVMVMLALILGCATAAFGQTVRKPPCDTWCQILGTDPPPFRRVIPVPKLPIPRRIGVVALAEDGGTNGIWGWGDPTYPNWVAADEITGYGISAVHLWPMVSLTDEPGWWPLPEGDDHRDMTWVFENPGLDLVVIRPMQHSFKERACDGEWASVWEGGGDWGEYTEDLYQKFGSEDKTIILTNWEGDWQLWGARCREPNECPTGEMWPSFWHEEYVACDGDYDCEVETCTGVLYNRAGVLMTLFNERQAAIQAVREAHPDAALTVLFGVTVNHTEDTEKLNLSRDVIPNLVHQPDVILLSHWDRDQTIVEALDYIQAHTRHVRYNMIVIEAGAKAYENQGTVLYEKLDAAMQWGVAAVFVWSWRYTGSGADYSIISQDNTPNPGMEAIQQLIRKYER